MTDLIVSMQGQFYQDAITKALEQTGNFRIWTLEKSSEQPEIALLGVSVRQGYTLAERQMVIRELKEKAPKCKIVLFVDELVAPEQTSGIKNLKQARVIDGFLYASGTMDYLVATLESI